MKKMQKSFGSIEQVTKKAIELSREANEPVEFYFNEIQLIAYATSDWRDVATVYDMASKLRRAKAGYRN